MAILFQKKKRLIINNYAYNANNYIRDNASLILGEKNITRYKKKLTAVVYFSIYMPFSFGYEVLRDLIDGLPL